MTREFRRYVRLLLFGLFTGAVFVRMLVVHGLHAGNDAARRRSLGRSFQTWARGMARILPLRFHVHGIPPQGTFYLVANHLSYLDAITLGGFAPASFVIRSDIRGWPIFGKLTRAAGLVFVNRENRRDLPRAIGELGEVLDSGIGAILFPEGTSSDGRQVLPFHPSLLEAPCRRGMPVVCAALAYTLPEDDEDPADAVCWWGDMELTPHLPDLFALRRIDVHIEFLAPLEPSPQRHEAARKTEAAIADALARLHAATTPDGTRSGAARG